MERKILTQKELVGKEYKKIMECRKRYLVVKGSRASKKSKNVAIRWIQLIYEFEQANLLAVRKYATLLKQSCRADLIWAIKRLGVEQDWNIPKGELTLTRKSTNQVILFRGANEPASIASISVDEGFLCWLWVEEAYQIEREEDFNMIDESIRGEVPEGYFKQTVLTFNPWHESSWLKKRFFHEQPGERQDNLVQFIQGKQKSTESVLALTRNYTCNEWLDKSDLETFERMKREQPGRYKVAGMGEWGVTGSTIYSNWEVRDFNWRALYYMKDETTGRPIYEHRIGLDFGYSHNTAGTRILVNRDAREIYICEELVGQRLSTDEIFYRLKSKGWNLEPIHADSEAPQTIKDLHDLGCPRIFGVKKEGGSVASGIQELRGYKIYVHPECTEFEIEISHYAYKKNANGKELPAPEKEWDHLMDAMRYAMKDESAGVEFVNTSENSQVMQKDEKARYETQLARLRRGIS